MKKDRYSISADIQNFSKGLNPTLEKAVIEAITNSLQANASEVLVDFYYTNNYPEKITITDNGVGFNDRNLKSFFKLYSAEKVKEGGKGIGRVMWTKFYKKISINSTYLEVDKKHRSFVIANGDFDNILVTTNDVDEDNEIKTIVSLEDSYRETLHDIRSKIRIATLNELFPMLLEFNKKQKKFKIEFRFHSDEEKCQFITNDDIKKEDEKYEFSITYRSKDYNFNLLCFRISGSSYNRVRTGFVAGYRTISDFNKTLELSINSPSKDDECSYIFLLESDYFNTGGLVTADRMKISIPDNRDFNGVSLKAEIKKYVSGYITEFFNSIYPDMEARRKNVINSVIEQYPQFLDKRYKAVIDEFILDNFGVFEPKKLIKKLNDKDFDEQYRLKEELKNTLQQKKIDEKRIHKTMVLAEKTSQQARSVLANYFWFRKAIIEELNLYIENKEKSESLLHNLFYKRYETTTEIDLTNCLWLLDDRFMSFCYFASEGVVEKVIEDIYQKEDIEFKAQKRMDFFICFNRKDDNDLRDCVIVEFKAIGASASEKSEAVSQIQSRYARALRNHAQNINNIFAYIITEIDDELAEDFLSMDFVENCTRIGKVFSTYNKRNSAFIFALGTSSIISDANDRHELFFKILRDEMTYMQRNGDNFIKK